MRCKSAMNKKAYFFTIDVIMSMMVLVTGFLIIWSFFLSEPEINQPYFLVRDTMDFLSTSRNSDIGNVEYVHDLILEGNITNLDNTALEQIAEFIVSDNNVTAKNYTRHIVSDVLPAQFGFEILMAGIKLYNQTGITEVSQENATALIVSKNVVVVVINRTEISYPMVAEVRVWQ